MILMVVRVYVSTMLTSAKHIHYFYNFGESFSKRTTEQFDRVQLAKCRSTKDMLLVGGGQDHCTFVVKQEVQYATSKPNLYQTPNVKKADEQLVVPAKPFVSQVKLNTLFNFTVHMDMEDNNDEGPSEGPSAKRIKIELSGETSKNQIFCTTLRKMVNLEELIIDSGFVDETPPVYSPFRRSTADLYMYHEKYYKQGVANVACIASDTQDDVYGNEEEDVNDDEDGNDEGMLRITCSGVWEMKTNGKATKQLYAYMMHIGYQLTVKALKEGEIIDVMVVYGLSVNYEKKVGWLFKLTVNFAVPERTIEDLENFLLLMPSILLLKKLQTRMFDILLLVLC